MSKVTSAFVIIHFIGLHIVYAFFEGENSLVKASGLQLAS